MRRLCWWDTRELLRWSEQAVEGTWLVEGRRGEKAAVSVEESAAAGWCVGGCDLRCPATNVQLLRACGCSVGVEITYITYNTPQTIHTSHTSYTSHTISHTIHHVLVGLVHLKTPLSLEFESLACRWTCADQPPRRMVRWRALWSSTPHKQRSSKQGRM